MSRIPGDCLISDIIDHDRGKVKKWKKEVIYIRVRILGKCEASPMRFDELVTCVPSPHCLNFKYSHQEYQPSQTKWSISKNWIISKNYLIYCKYSKPYVLGVFVLYMSTRKKSTRVKDGTLRTIYYISWPEPTHISYIPISPGQHTNRQSN